MKICIWADYTWCEWQDLECMLSFMSDDFATIEVPDEVEDIEQFVVDYMNGIY